MVTIAQAFGEIRPKFSATFRSTVLREVSQVGTKAGAELSDRMAKGFDSIGDRLSNSLEDVHARVGTKVGPGFVSLGGNLGGKILGGFAALGVGAAVAKLFTDSLDLDAASDKFDAQLGLTGKVAEKAGRAAGDLYAGAYGDSMEQVNAALKGVQDNIGDLGKFSEAQLEKMGAKALDLSTILEEDVGRTTRAVGQLIRNDLAKNTAEAFDLITAATQQGANASGDLLDTIEEYAPSFEELGFTGGQALGAVAAALEAGARNGDLAADAIKEFSIRAIDGSALTAEGFKLLKLDADAMADAIGSGGPKAREAFTTVLTELGKIKDPIKQEAVGVALFGTQFEDLGIKAILALNPTKSALDDVEGAADRMGQTLNDNAKTNIETFKRQLTTTATDAIGNHLLPALDDITRDLNNKLGPAIEDIKTEWGDFDDVVSGDARKISDDVAEFLGVRVPNNLNRSGNSFETYAERIEEAKRDGVGSFRDLWDLINDKNLTAGEKFGVAWSDIWSKNTRTEQRHLDLMKANASLFWNALTGDWKGFGRDLNTITGGVWRTVSGTVGRWLNNIEGSVARRIGDILTRVRVWGFVFQLAWFKLLRSVGDTVGRWGGNLVGWFKGLPGRIMDALGNIGQRIKNAFMDVLGDGLKIPINLLFGGDGLGIGPLGQLGGSLLGIAANSLVGTAYSLMGRPGDVISGARPGARTLSGGFSYHGQRDPRSGTIGRALDIVSPNMTALMLAIRSRFMGRTKELIGPNAGLGVLNGRNWHFSDAVQAQHDGRTRVAHVHWAMGEGGVGTVTKPTVFVAGERGREDFAFAPHSKGGMADLLGAFPDTVTVNLHLDGQVIDQRIVALTNRRQRIGAQRRFAGVR